MVFRLPQTVIGYAVLALLPAWSLFASADESLREGIKDDIKDVRKAIKQHGGSSGFIEAHGRFRVGAWKLGAEEGCAEGQWLLGCCYLQGVAVKQDTQEGLKWIGKSASQGFSLAENTLGRMYLEGNGVKRDAEKGRELFHKAADTNECAAQWNLGLSYEKGSFGKKDFKEAVKWYTRAAAQDHPASLQSLGEYHESGLGMNRNLQEAARLYRRASDLGNGLATAKLSGLTEHGLGVEKNAEEASRLRLKALRQLGKDGEQTIRRAELLMVPGVWRLKVKAGEEPYIMTLVLDHRGKGNLFVFRPTNADETEGCLLACGLSYRLERRLEGDAIVLVNCSCLAERNVKIGFAPVDRGLRLEGGTAYPSRANKAGVGMKGVWSHLDSEDPYGIDCGEGGTIEFKRFINKE